MTGVMLCKTEPFKVVGKSADGDRVFGYFDRDNVGKALHDIENLYPGIPMRVEPHNPLLTGKALRSTDVEWIVNDHGEIGVKIGEQMFFCYKGESIMYEGESSSMMYRAVEKREIGETLKSPDQDRFDGPHQTGGYDTDNRHLGWRPLNTETANNESAYINKTY